MRVLLVCLFAVAAAQNLVFEDDNNNKCTFSYDGTAVTTDCDIKGTSIESKLPCDKGFYKQNGNMADNCVACAWDHFKTTIDYGTCELHDQSCGAGQYYADYSTTQEGTCKACPAGTYSDSWTGVGETCKKHTLTCNKGQYLQGASSVSAGSCVACPANTYNDDANNRDSSCDWHGKCPPGQEPSTLSRRSASSCQPCAPGKYSSSASSHEMCKRQTTCASHQALIGASATSAGTCHDKCHDRYTGRNHNPNNGRDNIYLDRHSLYCPDHQVLGGMGMSDFRLTRPTHNTIEYKYRCCDLPNDGAVTRHWTGRNDDGRRSDRSTIYLDRHSLDCGSNKVIKSFKLFRPRHNQIEYEYECVQHSTAQCSSYTTPANAEGRSIIYLDRHHVDCPETSKPFLRYARLYRPRHDQIAYRYECCA